MCVMCDGAKNLFFQCDFTTFAGCKQLKYARE